MPTERAQFLLRALIQRYIRDGIPVGSRTLSKDSGLDLSPATIRNVSADLEDLGLVICAAYVCGSRSDAARVSHVRRYVDSLQNAEET